MLKNFTSYIKNNKLFTHSDRLLVALSGGADSITLCHLLTDAGYSFSVAHCNFNLRGKEADDDEKFVLAYCKKNKIPCFHTTFNTLDYAEKEAISIQMAARELRYNWFNGLIKTHHFDYLLTAHHANDNIETFFINLLRGSGINGLKAIVPKKDHVVRPLLFATRAEIENYIAKNKIKYREDSSNREDKYLRNNLRLQVIPALKKLNPSFEQTMLNEIEILQQTNLILQKEIEKQHKKLLLKENNTFKIQIEKLKKTTAPKLILFELLKDFGFNTSQANDVYNLLQAQPGKVITSQTHTLVKDRKFILIKQNEEKNKYEYFVEQNTKNLKLPLLLDISFKKGNINSIDKKDFSANKAFLDADTLHFPLKLTKWQTGDKFKPLGMSGYKKVSDFFTSQKATLFDKQNQWILRCNHDIVWLIGKRVDERFKVTETTKKICIITVNN